jgi:hypothetical protein
MISAFMMIHHTRSRKKRKPGLQYWDGSAGRNIHGRVQGIELILAARQNVPSF